MKPNRYNGELGGGKMAGILVFYKIFQLSRMVRGVW